MPLKTKLIIPSDPLNLEKLEKDFSDLEFLVLFFDNLKNSIFEVFDTDKNKIEVKLVNFSSIDFANNVLENFQENSSFEIKIDLTKEIVINNIWIIGLVENTNFGFIKIYFKNSETSYEIFETKIINNDLETFEIERGNI